MAEPKVPLSSSPHASANGFLICQQEFLYYFFPSLHFFLEQAAGAAVFNAVLPFPATRMD